MSSTLRIDASRANGAKSRGPVTPEGKEASAANAVHSTGPRTPEGKARSSLNAVTHGILASSITLRNECPDSFEKVEAALRYELQPRSYIDDQLIEIMTSHHWRRKRAWCIEKDQFDKAVAARENGAARENAAGPETTQENYDSPSGQTSLAFADLCEKSTVLKNVRRYEVNHSREFLRHLDRYESRRRLATNHSEITKRTEPNTG